LANSEKDLAEYDFAGIRYPPPLLQRRSCDTDHNKREYVAEYLSSIRIIWCAQRVRARCSHRSKAHS